MYISFKGYGENILTFRTVFDDIGVPAIAADDYYIYKAPAEADFIGITCFTDGECAGVIMNGYVEVPYTGTTPDLGFSKLVSDGTGGVKIPASSTECNHVVRVLKVDRENKIVGFIL